LHSSKGRGKDLSNPTDMKKKLSLPRKKGKDVYHGLREKI